MTLAMGFNERLIFMKWIKIFTFGFSFFLYGLLFISTNGVAGENRLRVYVTNFEGEKISVIDLADQKEIAQIETGKNPHGVVIAPDGSEVYVTNEGDGTLSFINPQDNKVTKTIQVGHHPQQPAISSDGITLYVPLNADHAIAIVNTKEKKLKSTLPVGRNPHIIIASPTSKRIYVTSEGDMKVVVVNTEANRVEKDIPLWAWPRVPSVTPDGKTLFQTIRWLNGALAVDLEKGEIVNWISLDEPKAFPKQGMVAHGLRVTPDGKELWLTTQLNNQVTILDAHTFQTLATLLVGKNPNWIEFTPDGQTAVISNTSSDTVSLINTKSRSVSKTIPVVKSPKRLAVGFVKMD